MLSKINSTNIPKILLQLKKKVVASVSPSTCSTPERYQQSRRHRAALARGDSPPWCSCFFSVLQVFSRLRSKLAPIQESPFRAPRDRPPASRRKSLRALQPFLRQRRRTARPRRP